MDRPHRERIVEEVAEPFVNAAVGTTADQDQAKRPLLQPGFGDGQVDENPVGSGVGVCESRVESLLGLGRLLVDELAADLMVEKVFTASGGQPACGRGLPGRRVVGRRVG